MAYKHSRQSRSTGVTHLRLVYTEGDLIDDEVQCAELLDRHFQDQFCQDQQSEEAEQL